MKQTSKSINLSRFISEKINLPTGIYRDGRGSVFVKTNGYSEYYNPRSTFVGDSPI